MNFLVNIILDFMRSLRNGCAVVVLLTLVFAGQFSQAQTVVNVTTDRGNFSIELFDTVAPATVENFLSYVVSGRYNGTVIHRAAAEFVIQGGGFNFDTTTQAFSAINLNAPIVNEFNISNTRGTLAMAKMDGDPNSATSQWFVNLADNSANLDSQNGGFTVFGRVIEPGMTVVDAISNLPVINANGLAGVPVVQTTNDDGNVTSQLIGVQMSVSAPPGPIISNTFDAAAGLLKLKVAIDGAQFLGVSFRVVSLEAPVVIRGLLETVEAETSGDASFASFSSADSSLVIPKIYINEAVAARNVRFVLTDPDQLLFTLVSVE